MCIRDSFQGEVHHHDGVLLDDTDQQQDPQKGDQAEFGAGRHESEQGADARGGKRRQDGERLAVTFVQNTQHHVDREQCGDQHQRRVAVALLEELGGAVSAALNGDGDVDLIHFLFDGREGGAERYAIRQVEGDGGRHRGSRVVDADRRGADRKMTEGGEWHDRFGRHADRRPGRLSLIHI